MKKTLFATALALVLLPALSQANKPQLGAFGIDLGNRDTRTAKLGQPTASD